MCKEVDISTTDLQIFPLSEVDRDTLKERKKKTFVVYFVTLYAPSPTSRAGRARIDRLRGSGTVV